MMQKDTMKMVIQRFPDQKILVVGDLMLDQCVWCDVDRISPEAPVPVGRVMSEQYGLGGAANVAANLASLGVRAEVIGVVGKDTPGAMLTRILREKQISGRGVLRVAERLTTLKTRVMAGTQQMLRVDRETRDPIPPSQERQILRYLRESVPRADVVVLSDYSKGVVTQSVARSVLALARPRGIPVLVDPVFNVVFPNRGVFSKFRGAYLVKPNKREAELIVGKKLALGYRNARTICKALRSKFFANILITLGRDGMLVWHEGRLVRIPTAAREVYDVTGAGDTVMAVLAASIASGASLEEAARISNLCAGIVVGKLGTATVSLPELHQSVNQYASEV